MSAGQHRAVKLGIVGCGFGGTRTMYAPILRLLESAKVTALMDPSPAALAFMTENYGWFDCYTDLDDFLAHADVEAVLIASPAFLHAEQAIKAAAAGKHVLCEKPLAPTVAECDRMIAAAAAHDVILMAAHARRFDKSLILAGKLVAEGRLGQLFHIHADTSWCHDESPLGPNWRQSRRTLGGIFQDNGCHAIDLCRLWAGEIVSVAGEARVLRPDWEVETFASAILRHASGAVSTLHMSNVSQQPMTERYLLEGRLATLELTFGPAAKYGSPEPFAVHLWEGGKRCTDLTLYNDLNLDREISQHGMYKRQVDNFCAAVLGEEPAAVTGDDGRKAVEVINAFYVAAAERRTVPLPLTDAPPLAGLFDHMKMAP